MRARFVPLGLLCVLAAGGSPAPASAADGRLRARFVGPADAELVARVRGQTGDLDGWVVERMAGPVPAGPEAALGEAGDARVVFWVRGEGPRLTVFVLDVPSRRLLVRDVAGRAGETLGLSAAREAVGLVVRGALQALALGDPVGEVLEDEAEEEAVESVPEETPAASPALAVSLTAGWGLAHDARVAHGPRVGVSLGGGRLHGELAAATDLPLVLEDPELRVELARHRLLAGARVRLAGGERGGLEGAFGLAWLRYRRTSRAQGGLVATATRRSDHLVLAARVEGSLRLGAGLSLVLALGVDGVVRPPELRIEELDGAMTSWATLRRWQSRAALALRWRFTRASARTSREDP